MLLYSNIVDEKEVEMKFKRGFTLIELLVVIAIITLLASIAVPNYIKQLEKTKVGKATADIMLLRKSVDLFRADNGGDISKFTSLDALFPEYLSKPVPKDPWKGSYSCTVTATSYTITDSMKKVSETITF